MMSLMKGVFGPSINYQDKLMYMTSLGLNHSIGSDRNAKNPTCVEQILNLITSPNTRYLGLQLLELALQQNLDNIYNKGRWVLITYNIIKDSHAANLEKIQAFKILSIMIPYMADDPSFDTVKDEFIKDIFPVLLERICQQVEWAEEASICVKMALKTFPRDLAYYQMVVRMGRQLSETRAVYNTLESQSGLLDTILSQASSNVSSKSFEVLAECFCELPYCSKDNNAEAVQVRWEELYLRTLKTIESIQVACLSRMSGNDPYERLGIDLSEFNFKEETDESNFFPAFVKRVRRFVNLCKCLAKLLSVKPKYPMKVPVSHTVKCLIPLYTSCRKEKLTSSDEEILCTFIAQMQLAGLLVLETLILNCNLLKYTVLMRDLMRMSIQSSNTLISSEHVSELRIATWKLITLWLDGFGRKVSKEIAGAPELTEEILNDINIDATESLQGNDATQSHNKSKKNTSLDSSQKSVLKRKNLQRVCEAALNSLESLLYTGALDIPKAIFQEICKRVFKICNTIHSSCVYPFPYNDESCREKLYSVVLTIAVVLKPEEFQILQTAMKILAHINNDPSFKVRKLSNKVPVMYRLQFYPKRPLPLCSDNKQRQPNISNEVLRYSQWSSPEYVQNLKIETVSETPENVNINVEQSFQNENEIEVHSEEFMEVETHYNDQIIENQCNGEDLLEIQASSQCQDDIESDEEEEEEEEERSYGDEETNQEEHLQEMYIPASRKSPLPVQINAESVQSITEPEYEELTPCIKSEENSHNTSNKEKCVNGEDNVIHEEVPSSSTQVTNENGIFGVEDDDLDEENDDEEEEESETFPAEKKAESYDPPPKRQKVEAKEEEDEVDERIENARSPTLDQMKADFLELIPSSEDVNSGKVQTSTS